MGLKTLVRNYKLNKLRKQNKNRNGYQGFDKVESVGICFERNKSSKEVLKYADKLQQMGKKVSLLEYIPKRKREIEKDGIKTDEPWFGKGDLNFSGEPSNDDVSRFLGNSYGVYIDLTPSEVHPADFISLKVKADLKVGNSKRADLQYDLMLTINENNNFEPVFKELDYYLNFINQNKE